jgi:DNA-binding transcriptional ArsR family regulator
MTELALLAVTRMLSGICIGGVPPGGGAWVRPRKEFGTLLLGDVRTREDDLLAPFDVVEFQLLRPRPDPPHVEDWTCDFLRARPRRIRRLDEAERAALLEACADPAARAEWEARRRSLVVVRAEHVTAHFSLDDYSGKYEARLEWDGHAGPVPVTDLRWRALGRRLLPPGGGHLTLDRRQLAERIDGDPAYLALGLSRNFQGETWPIVVGVHCLPDYAVTVDLANL